MLVCRRLCVHVTQREVEPARSGRVIRSTAHEQVLWASLSRAVVATHQKNKSDAMVTGQRSRAGAHVLFDAPLLKGNIHALPAGPAAATVAAAAPAAATCLGAKPLSRRQGSADVAALVWAAGLRLQQRRGGGHEGVRDVVVVHSICRKQHLQCENIISCGCRVRSQGWACCRSPSYCSP